MRRTNTLRSFDVSAVRTHLTRLIILAGASLAAVATAQTTGAGCGSGQNHRVCMGKLDVPERHRPAFVEAARMAVDGLHSDQFKRELEASIRDHAHSGDHAKYWRGVTADQVIPAMRRAIHGQEVTTYGGIGAWFNNRLWGNLAYDGTESGPILVNREGLPRSSTATANSASIANTIAHEVAHRVGLSHRRQGRSAAARCEPPYVIGTLIERQVLGASWRRDSGDCERLPPA